MLLDLNHLAGPRARIERTLAPAVFDPPDELYRVAAPVELVMDVQKAGAGTFDVSGHFHTRLELTCGRCLEPFEMPVEAPFELRYVPSTQNVGEAEREIGEDDLTTAYYREGVLDITDLLREQFQLALPMKPLCTEACRGLCPECGANLNRTDCGHTTKWEDPRFEPLKGLLSREKEN